MRYFCETLRDYASVCKQQHKKTHPDIEKYTPHAPDFFFLILPQQQVHEGKHQHSEAEIFWKG